MSKKPVFIGNKEGLGGGMIFLGFLLLLIPSLAKKTIFLYLTAEAMKIVIVAIYAISIFIILTGLAIVISKMKDGEGE